MRLPSPLKKGGTKCLVRTVPGHCRDACNRALALFHTFQQAQQLCPPYGVLARSGIELAKQVFQVPFHGFFADFHGISYFFIRKITREMLEYLAFLRRQYHAR